MDIDELLRQLQSNMDEGLLSQLYRVASVSPDEVLIELRDLGLEVYSVGEITRVPTALLDPVANACIRQTGRAGAISGASFGLGGLLSVAPELAYLMVTLLRMAQRLSLIYGYEVESPRGRLDLWTALGRSLGITIDLEGLESDLYRGLPMIIGRGKARDPLLLKVAQKVMVTVGLKMSTRISRMIPLLGAGVGSVTNYAYLSKVGRRLKDDLRTQHQLRHVNFSDPSQSEEISFTLENHRG